MERIRSKSYYKLLILLLGLSLAAYANAQSEYYSVSSNKLTHYLGIALGGGEANRLQPKNEAIKNKAGAAAAFGWRCTAVHLVCFNGSGQRRRESYEQLRQSPDCAGRSRR